MSSDGKKAIGSSASEWTSRSSTDSVGGSSSSLPTSSFLSTSNGAEFVVAETGTETGLISSSESLSAAVAETFSYALPQYADGEGPDPVDGEGPDPVDGAPDLNDSSPSTELVRIWPTLLSRLMSETHDDEWQQVLARIHSHPHEIRIFGRNAGRKNAMHAACVRYPPSHIVRAMLDADSGAALIRNASGETPLHLAIDSASEEIQEMLIRAAPDAAAMSDQYGDLPIHAASRNGATVHLMEQLLSANPESICQPNIRKMTPFWLLRRSYLDAEDLDEVLEEDSEIYVDDWNLLVLFLRYSYYGRAASSMTLAEIQDYDNWIVHAAAACPACPREVLRFLCRIFPSQTVGYNTEGYTPLILATRREMELEEPEQWNAQDDSDRQNVEVAGGQRRGYDEVSVSSSTAGLRTGESDFLRQIIVDDDRSSGGSPANETSVDILLEWCPRSVYHADRQGRLPLAHALITAKPWVVVRSLTVACPRVVECRDRVSGLYMFQLAALHDLELDTIYTLARATPELLLMGQTVAHQDSLVSYPSHQQPQHASGECPPRAKRLRLE